MELQNINQIEKAAAFGASELFRLGFALVFIVCIMLFAGVQLGDMSGNYMLISAAVIGGYMAMNIGANDVANNVGPAVGSKALTLAGAITIAAIFEAFARITTSSLVATASLPLCNARPIGLSNCRGSCTKLFSSLALIKINLPA